MSFLFLVLIFCFLIFLYIVYLLSHDDFVILRTNTSMEKIFNAAFLSSILSLFVARFFYVFLNPKPVFLNPLGFLLFPYFPGLSLMGAMLGGFLISFYILKSWNLPAGRILDFFSIAFFISYPFGFLGSFFLSGSKVSPTLYLSLLLYFILLSILLKFVLPPSLGGKIKEGNLSLLFISCFTLYYLASNLMFGQIVTYENILAVFVLLGFVGLLVKKENLVEKLLLKIKELGKQ